MTTIEYASPRARERLKLPGRWPFLIVSLLSVGVVFMPFIYDYSPLRVALDGPDELWSLIFGFFTSPAIAWLVIRLGWWTLARWEWWLGAAIAAMNATAIGYFAILELIAILKSGMITALGLPMFGGSLAIALGTAWAIFRLGSSHHKGIGLLMLLMGLSIVNGFWAVGVTTRAFYDWQLQYGAWACSAVCLCFIAETAWMLARDWQWRRR